MKSGITLIREERRRQIEKEGWTPAHDDGHADEELATAAAAYSTPLKRRLIISGLPLFWPWLACWWKPNPKKRIRELAKAGALIAAEIDRIQRAQKRGLAWHR